MRSPDKLPRTPGARPPVPRPPTARGTVESQRTLAVVSEPALRSATPGDPQPPVRTFLARYESTHALTADVLARRLRLPPTVFARYADSNQPPRWLVLAIAGVGTACGIPVEELRWLLEAISEK